MRYLANEDTEERKYTKSTMLAILLFSFSLLPLSDSTHLEHKGLLVDELLDLEVVFPIGLAAHHASVQRQWILQGEQNDSSGDHDRCSAVLYYCYNKDPFRKSIKTFY